jgi:hypothetical protein
MGQKQTFALHQLMSALPPKPDICSAMASNGMTFVSLQPTLASGSGRKRCPVFRPITRWTLKRALHHVRHQRRETYKRHWTAASKAVWPVDQ